MSHNHEIELSVVVPVFNEAAGIANFHQNLINALDRTELSSYEIIYCNDGSSDNSLEELTKIAADNQSVSVISFTRNFGKEYALTAGISASVGDAVLSIDGDGQHPVNLLDEFITRWRGGARLVIGLRDSSQGSSFNRRLGSSLFHWLFNHMSNQTLLPGSTDYRLIDVSVRQEFLRLNEDSRITRGLIDWLGFEPEYVHFEANSNDSGSESFSFSKQLALASSSFTSLAVRPLYLFGYLGIFITITSLIAGLIIIFEQFLLNDPLAWDFTGSAMLAILIIFFVGIILMSQGILSLYVSSLLKQSKNRPLYIIDRRNSVNINAPKTK